jgi:hypothetical protein
MLIRTLLIGCFVLPAGCPESCDGPGSGSAESARRSAEIGRGLVPGAYEIEFSGRLVTGGPYTGDLDPVRFGPQTYAATRELADGFGGRERVETSNAEGPYQLVLRTSVQREGGEAELARVWVQLPPGARGGQRYVVRDSRRAKPGEAYAGVEQQSRTWQEIRNLEGSIEVAELGDHLTAAFDFHSNLEPGDEKRFDVKGRAYRIPFRPRPEARYTFTANGDGEQIGNITLQAQEHRFGVIIGPRGLFSFEFDGRPQAGTYALGRTRDARTVLVTVLDHSTESLEGTLELNETDGIYSATYEFSTKGADAVRAKGRFDHVPAP